jgi:hypothetical protein
MSGSGDPNTSRSHSADRQNPTLQVSNFRKPAQLQGFLAKHPPQAPSHLIYWALPKADEETFQWQPKQN